MTALTHRANDVLWQGPGINPHITTLKTSETFNQPACMTVTLRCDDCLNPYDLVGLPVKLAIAAGPVMSLMRPLNGLITQARQLRTGHGNLEPADQRCFLYEFRLHAPVWCLGQTSRTRVYQRLTVQAIVSTLLNEAAVPFVWRAEPGSEREYCVQYEESNLAFMTRLLEAEGMVYYQDHGADQLVIADHHGAFPPCEPTADARYEEYEQIKEKDCEVVRSAEFAAAMGTRQVAVHDYNYETALYKLDDGESVGLPGGVGELYHHNTLHRDDQGARLLAKRRGESLAANLTELRGTATCRSFALGSVFRLNNHYLDALNTDWLIRHLEIDMVQGDFHCRYIAVTTERPYRPPLATPTPCVAGLQTAVVTGPPGSKVYLDPLGRCKLQFHWDREGAKDDLSSMWVRVANNYAGKDYGIQFIPRVGHEVLVEFLKGNPDHPVVVGRVYNSDHSAPLGPPNKYQNMIKTIKDNHIIFDDSDGAEMVDMRSQKDLKVEVVNDSATSVGRNKTTQTGLNQLLQIGANYAITVGANQVVNTVGNYARSTAQNETVMVKKNREEQVDGKRTITVKDDNVHTVRQGDYVLKVSKGTVYIDAPKVVIKTGASKLTMTGNLVTVESPLIKMN